MPTKAEMYAQMADKVATQLVGSWQEWTAFLTTAARLYKYPFHEQLMIYAQRPDATACAEYDLWNNRMGRYVRRGSKGIALVDDSGDRPRLRYVFDISDTGTRPNSRTPWLWQLEEQHIGPVSAMLERNYGIAGDDLAQQLTDVAGKLASEYWDEHQQDFRYIVDGSFLEEYDDLNVAVQFKSAATVSIAYALMSRCGLEPERYFQHEDFMSIFDFNTPATVGALGAAVSQINQQVLRQIGVTIQNYEREHLAERSITHGEQPDLHEERRLPDSRPEPERAAEEAPGQVRQDAESIPEGTPSPDLQPSADEREAVPAPAGDRGDGEQPSGADDAPAGGVGGRDGGAESPRSDALGGPDEHLQGTGRGDSDGGAYQQLTLNLFLSEAEQIQRIDEAENVQTSSAFSFAQEQPQPQAADQEAEAAKPTLRELHEKYKPIVLEAVSQDIRYRNACGHSDYENAMIECNAAVRRAILDSHDIELIRLFSDVPEFRQRLHREVADETYPKLHELLRPLSDNDIDRAIQAWNGKIESKHAVVRYMKDHAREKDTAAWLAHEFDGGEGKTPLAIRPESPNGMALPWPKVQRRIAQLIKEERFYTQVEKDNLDDVDPIAIRETLAQRGIVDGQVVDPEKLDRDPFVQRVMADARRIAAEETSEQPTPPDLSGQPITRAGDTITIGNGDTVHEIDITVSDEEYEAIRQTIPDEKADDPSAPIYHVGDTVYLENQEYRITELREDARNEATTDPQPLNPETVDQEHTEPSAETLRSGSEQTGGPETPPQPAPGNFRIMDDNLGTGGPKEKFWRNIKAIATLKQIEQENRHATLEEQHLLSQYVGWGGIPDVFDPQKPAWTAEYSELKELLTPEEYAAARGSTLNAHYTSPTVIRAIYEAVGHMGFKTGNILEPSCGVGNFFGMLPESMAGSKLYGVELDSISGRIARQLYPKADITVAGFETTDRRDFYDLAIGNVPFGQYQVNDKAYNKLGFNIHNYFFAKALDQVRPGGIVAFVTSRYTMDAKDSTVRRYLAQRAELLGAIRLPNTAFKANAGTEVVSDIIFLQRRGRPLDIVQEWTQTGQTEDGFAINRYFLDHPEMVLGRQEPESTAHGMDYTVNPIEGLELADQLHDAVKYIRGTYQEAELPELGEDEAIDTSIPADPNVKNYSYTVVDGDVYYRENSRMVRPNLNATAEARVKGLVGLRECVQQLIDLQMDAATPDSDIREKQAELNRLYDDFSAKYGLINDRANRLAFADDSSYYLLCALEIVDEDGKLERKADMFTQRTIKPHEAVTTVDTASEALAVSIAEKARVDMEYMEQLTGKTGDELVSELQGVIFRVPGQVEKDGTPHYVTADEYLSGNVRRKLRQAQRAAQQDPAFVINVEALTAAQPKDLDASEIEVRLGATWIDKKYIQQFMYETFNTPYYLQRAIQVNYAAYTAEWQVTGKSSVSENDVAAYTTYGTSRANAYKILEDSLNLRDVRIYDTVEDADGKERRVLNARETTLAAQKQQAIRDAFKDWIWRNPERRRALVHQYNEEMNSTRPREYDGSHITFGGMNPSITLRDHQLGAIAHILYGGNTLLAHEVGAGKTFEMVAAAMEAKRLGLCQKSLFVVPNHLTEQWASEFLRLYPSAKILVTTKKDFETHNRKKFCAKIATGDYDAVIIGHSQFEKIPISHERQERLLQEQIDEITEGISEVKYSGGERFTVKQLERTKKSLEARLEKLQAEGRKDDVVTFEQLGVDRLFVDEAHNYKNLFLYTKMRNVAGLSTSDAQKSSDMFAKCRYMDEITGSRGVIFATGTPVSNSMTELYTMQRYLQYDRLQELNMTHFDCWASRFGETVTALELAPEGYTLIGR
jgi:N12 class adenine-specific DNA methylase